MVAVINSGFLKQSIKDGILMLEKTDFYANYTIRLIFIGGKSMESRVLDYKQNQKPTASEYICHITKRKENLMF